MLDLPSVIAGAAAVVVGNVIIASLNHWLQSSREQKAHERQKEREEVAHLYRLHDARGDRLRAEYTKILSAVYTLSDVATPGGVGVTREAIEQKTEQVWRTLFSINAELRQSQAALRLEGSADPEILALLTAIAQDAGAYVVGKQENYRASKTDIIPADPPFPFEELRGYLKSIEVNTGRLEGLLAEQLAIPRLPASPRHKG